MQKKNSPKQKFKKGERVKIAEDLGKYMSHFRSGVEATVLYSYRQEFGYGDRDQYAVKFDDGISSAWYKEWQLTLVVRG